MNRPLQGPELGGWFYQGKRRDDYETPCTWTHLVHTTERREVDGLAPHHTGGSYASGVFAGAGVDHRVHKHLVVED